MSSVDNLFHQLEKRSAERFSSQGPMMAEDDDQSYKSSAVLNGSPNIIDNNYSSDRIIRTIESVGNINSYEFINKEKLQPVNYTRDSADISRTKANGSVDVQKVDTSGVVQSEQQTTSSDSMKHISGGAPIHHPAKLQKQKALDLTTNELSVHLADSSSISPKCSSNHSRQQTEISKANDNVHPNSDSVDIDGEGFQKSESKDFDEPVEFLPRDIRQESLEEENTPQEVLPSAVTQSLEEENTQQDVLSNVVTQSLEEEDTLQEVLPSDIRQESLEEEDVPQFTIPDEIPAVTGWKLDRRESGHLFWRRDSSTLNGVDPRSRVKFRYDVEVCEFETRGSETEDLLEEDEEEQDSDALNCEGEKQNKDSVSDASFVAVEHSYSVYYKFVYLFAFFGIIVSLVYGWLKYLFFSSETEETQNN